MLEIATYSIGAKVARRSQYKDGYLPTLMDLDRSELAALLKADFDEVDPADLPTLPHNARIIYVRHDTGKTVLNSIIVKHFISKGGVALTLLAPPASNTVAISAKAITRGFVRVGALGSYRYTISSARISQLYVCKTVALSDRVEAAEARAEEVEAALETAVAELALATAKIEALQQLATRAMQAIIELDERMAAVESASQKTNALGDHVAKQRQLLGDVIKAHSELRGKVDLLSLIKTNG